MSVGTGWLPPAERQALARLIDAARLMDGLFLRQVWAGNDALLQQLSPNGVMVIPVGPPGAQHVLKVVKQKSADGAISVARSDIYQGGRLSFVPFTKLEGDAIRGTHSGR